MDGNNIRHQVGFICSCDRQLYEQRCIAVCLSITILEAITLTVFTHISLNWQKKSPRGMERHITVSKSAVRFQGHSETSQIWILGILWRMHMRKGVNFHMLMYPDLHQNWLDFGHGLFIASVLVVVVVVVVVVGVAVVAAATIAVEVVEVLIGAIVVVVIAKAPTVAVAAAVAIAVVFVAVVFFCTFSA